MATMITACKIALLLLLAPMLCLALEIVPFRIQNQNPLIQPFGLPSPGDARVLSPGNCSAALFFDLASNYVATKSATESLLLDGESYRFNLISRWGFSPGFEAGIEIPWLAYGGGTIDGFIQDWHNFFGLPQGGRDQAPNNRLRYRYSRNGVERLAISNHHGGIGDLMFTGGWQCLGDGATPQAAALRAGVKLPTGDPGLLTGSGGTDLSLWLVGRSDHSLTLGHATIYGAAGGLYLSPGNILRELQRHWVMFGSLGAGWSPWEFISFSIQLDATTPFHGGSSLAALSGRTLGLIMGGSLALGERTVLELGVAEDLAATTWPDVTFHMGITHRF